MNLLEFNYENQIIEFDLSGEEVMINATEMGKVFNKKPYEFLRQEDTKRFIEELKRSIPAFRSVAATLLNAGNAVLPSENDVRSVANEEEITDLSSIYHTVKGKNADGGSTWMHRLLALKFAAWLDPNFEVWIFSKIEEITFGNYKKHWEAHAIQERAKLDMESLKTQMLTNPTIETNIAYFEALDSFNSAKSIKSTAIRNQYKLFGVQDQHPS